jgi:hypothetical protein
MSKRLGLALVALLIVPMLLAACGSESRDVAEDFVDAVLTGDVETAQSLACDSFKDRAAALAQEYGTLNVHDRDLKYDIGKGNNQNEIIVTGSYKIGPEDKADEIELAHVVRGADGESVDTRIVLWLTEDGDEWCINDDTQFGGADSAVPMDEAESQGALEPELEGEPEPEATEDAEE